jgi:hypothetical protein
VCGTATTTTITRASPSFDHYIHELYIYISTYSNHHNGLYERIDGHEWWSTGDGIHLSHFETE